MRTIVLISRSPYVRHAKAPPRHSLSSTLRCTAMLNARETLRRHIKWSNEKHERRVPPRRSVLVALKPPRRPNNQSADIQVERSIEMAFDGESGLYPGGKSPRRNQHDRGERPTWAYTYNATGIIPDYLRRSVISISTSGADYHRLYSYIVRELPYSL